MENEEKRMWCVRLSFDRKKLVGFAALVLVSVLAMDLSTESLTLTTYYPAPYGAYKELRATQNAYFGYVDTKSDPNDPDNPRIGVGTDNPQTRLHVNGNVTGDQFLDSEDNTFFLDPANRTESANLAGHMTIGDTSSVFGERLNIIKGYVHLPQQASCIKMIALGSRNESYSETRKTPCASNRYATMIPGIFQEGEIRLPGFDVYDADTSISGTKRELVVVYKPEFYCCSK